MQILIYIMCVFIFIIDVFILKNYEKKVKELQEENKQLKRKAI